MENALIFPLSSLFYRMWRHFDLDTQKVPGVAECSPSASRVGSMLSMLVTCSYREDPGNEIGELCWQGHMSALLGRVVHVRLFVCELGFSRPYRKNFFRLSTKSFYLPSSSLNRFQLSSTMAQKKPFERLPTSVLPRNYKLTLKPNLTEFTFTGEEVIDVEVIEY